MSNNNKKNASSDFIDGSKQLISGTTKILKSGVKTFEKILKFTGKKIGSSLKFLNKKYNIYKDEKDLEKLSNMILEKIKSYIETNKIQVENNKKIFQDLDEKDFNNIFELIKNNEFFNSTKFSKLNKIDVIKSTYNEIFLIQNCDLIPTNNSTKFYELKS